MILVETHIVPLQPTPIRIQEYLVGIFTTVSTKSAIKKAIKKGFIFVDDKPTSTAKLVCGGETISIFKAEEKQFIKQFNLKITVVYEDDYLAIINKPAGILVSGNKKYTLENALPNNLTKSKQKDALLYPEPIHRLDYPTSGALLIGKTSKAVILLNKMFEQQQIKKKYRCLLYTSDAADE